MYKVRVFRGETCIETWRDKTPMDCLRWLALQTIANEGFNFHKAECTNADGNEQWKIVVA